ncbi:FHA domain-containing protein [Rhodococcus jostii]|uniref:FHA domain-containing protein n=1 Tax=Rhodococcus jostii TaxID=132919 RepID=A0A1H4IRP9_RHOJO|nr:FHA domain-containing protein [Rhodococcus jostii]SEB36316.1 FHA domain-containing protein [Rhodococcus jostii]
MNRIEGERLCYTDGQGRARELMLYPAAGRVTVGRSHRSDVALTWDRTVSRLHAAIEWRDTHWSIIDDGLSRNGTFVNGERLAGRRQLRSGDIIQVGTTVMTFRGLVRPDPGRTRVRVFIAALAKHGIHFDRDAAHTYLLSLAGAASEQNAVNLDEDQLWCTDERIEQEARNLADRVRRSKPGRTAERGYYGFTPTSTNDLLVDLSRSILVVQDADTAGTLPTSLPITDLARNYVKTVRELHNALAVEPFASSSPGFIGYLILGGDVIDDMAALFEAAGSLLLDHGYRPTPALRIGDPLLLATKAIARASALRSVRGKPE